MQASSGEVTAIIPVWNRRDLLERLLCALPKQSYPIAEVVVVDDGSSDGSAEMAERMGARAARLGAHRGFAAAVNRGIQESHTPLLAIVNNDVELAPDWLEKLAVTLGPEVWFVTGRILQSGAPELIDATYDALCRGCTSWRMGHGRADGPAFRAPRIIASAPFTAALFRAELFDGVGPLDERFESYLEDVDFGLRCASAGRAGKYVPDALAWHHGSATLGRWHPETVRLIARNQLFLAAKHYPARMLWRYLYPIIVAQGLWGLVALRHGQGWAWLQGKWEGLRRSTEFRSPGPRRLTNSLPKILRENERDIRRVQREAGGDLYWALYFLLTGGGTK